MKICVQTGGLIGTYSPAEAYRLIRDAGFEGVDWNIDHAWSNAMVRKDPSTTPGTCIFEKPLPDVLKYYREELDAIRANGLTVSQAHAPFPAFVPGFPDFLEYAIGIYVRCIELCRAVDCPNLVVHGISWPFGEPDLSREEVYRLNLHLYRGLMPALKEGGVTVCLENLFTRRAKTFEQGHCAVPEEAAALIDRLNEEAGKECFGLLLDTGHLNILRSSFRRYVPVLGKRLKALHIHDNDASEDQHLAPYCGGNICWPEFCDVLRACGYTGDLCFETFRQITPAHLYGFQEMVPVSLSYIARTGQVFRARIQGMS